MAVTLKGQTAVYEGTSTDTKPTDADNNSIFKELDTGISYYYDGTDWNEIPSSGGGGGGTGTDNYNELNNKPSINGTTLSGNKSLDNLGIQAKLTFDSAPTEDSKNPVTSGGVYSALAGKQDTISDLSTIRSGAAAGASAVQPAAMEAALSGKQATLTTAQLAAANSGITSADVAQITTNKNNILSDNIISTSFTWGNGYISTGGHIFASSQSYFSQPFTLHAGEKIVVRTKNKNICVIGSTTADSVAVGDNITILRTTSGVDQEETYDYTATEDIKIVICVIASNYVAYVSNHNTDLLLGSYATAAIKRLESRVTALENQ